MRVAWNLAYHCTCHQQDSDRPDRDRKADTSPSFEPNDRVLLRVPLDQKTHKLCSYNPPPKYSFRSAGYYPNPERPNTLDVYLLWPEVSCHISLP